MVNNGLLIIHAVYIYIYKSVFEKLVDDTYDESINHSGNACGCKSWAMTVVVVGWLVTGGTWTLCYPIPQVNGHAATTTGTWGYTIHGSRYCEIYLGIDG